MSFLTIWHVALAPSRCEPSIESVPRHGFRGWLIAVPTPQPSMRSQPDRTTRPGEQSTIGWSCSFRSSVNSDAPASDNMLFGSEARCMRVIEAIRQWKHAPAFLEGRPVAWPFSPTLSSRGQQARPGISRTRGAPLREAPLRFREEGPERGAFGQPPFNSPDRMVQGHTTAASRVASVHQPGDRVWA